MKKLILILISFCAMGFNCMAQNDSFMEFSSFGSLVCGIAGDSGILVSKDDGVSWSYTDFNEAYKDYYPTMVIKAVAAGDRTMAIAGTDVNGNPVMYFSFDGNVWSPRQLSYTENGRTYYLDQQPVKLEYDAELDRMIMYCENDTIFYVPNCSHCNSIKRNNQ